MAGLELRICEHTVPGVFPTASYFTWLYMNFVLSLTFFLSLDSFLDQFSLYSGLY